MEEEIKEVKVIETDFLIYFDVEKNDYIPAFFEDREEGSD